MMAKLNKEAIALNLLTCRTLDECAEKSGISKATLYRMRKKDTEFQEVINQVKKKYLPGHNAEGTRLLHGIIGSLA